MRRKKKGATLIVVIIIFMFVCSVSMAMLSMAASNYTARVSESKRIENLYSSESGIDMAYNITGKTITAGIKYGYYQVSQLRNHNFNENEIPPDIMRNYDNLCKDIKFLDDLAKADQIRIDQIKKKEKPSADDAKEIERLYKEITLCKNGMETDEATKNEVYKEEFKIAFKIFIQKEKGASNVPDHTNVLADSVTNKEYIDVSLTNHDGSKVNDPDEKPEDSKIKKVDIVYNVFNVEFPNEQKGKDKDGNDVVWPNLSVNKLLLNKCPEEDKVTISNVRAPESDKKRFKATSTKDSEEKHNSEYKVELDRISNEYYDLTIDSQFLSKESNTGVIGENKREIEASYKIKVPNYDDVLWGKSSGEIKKYTVFKDNRGLTIGGNMDVDRVGNLYVRGDIFVQGKSLSGDDYREAKEKYGAAYVKYMNGIKINESKVNFLPVKDSDNIPNVNTRGTFNIQNNSVVNDVFSSDKFNIYAKNIYAGDINKDDKFVSNSTLNVNDVVTDNDLTVQATGTIFNIQNFYGINDKNIKYDDGKNYNPVQNPDDYTYTDTETFKTPDPDSESGELEKSSSSIIINGKMNNKSTVNILNEAYIMGTAHISTDGNYQTGESIAVKSDNSANYMAYAVPVCPDEKFKYDNPLQVLDEDNVFKKAEHFNNYWNGKNNGGIDLTQKDDNGEIKVLEADDGGIRLPDHKKIHSIGAIVYKVLDKDKEKTQVVGSNYNMADERSDGDVYIRRAEYAEHVYDLGLHGKYTEEGYANNYKAGINADNVDTVQDLLKLLTEDNLKGLPNSDWNKQYNSSKNGTEVAIFNPTTDSITISASETNAVIVTNGDVIIDASAGDVNFQGNIIAKGNLIVKGPYNATIEYNQKVVDEVQGNNSELFAAVFGQFLEPKEKDNGAEDKTMLKQVLDGQYDIKRYLENKLWKLIK